MHLFSTKTYSREIWKILEIPICGDPDFLKNFQKIRNFSDPGKAGFLSCLPEEKRVNSDGKPAYPGGRKRQETDNFQGQLVYSIIGFIRGYCWWWILTQNPMDCRYFQNQRTDWRDSSRWSYYRKTAKKDTVAKPVRTCGELKGSHSIKKTYLEQGSS